MRRCDLLERNSVQFRVDSGRASPRDGEDAAPNRAAAAAGGGGSGGLRLARPRPPHLHDRLRLLLLPGPGPAAPTHVAEFPAARGGRRLHGEARAGVPGRAGRHHPRVGALRQAQPVHRAAGPPRQCAAPSPTPPDPPTDSPGAVARPPDGQGVFDRAHQGLDPNWESNLAVITTALRPFLANRTCAGVFVGVCRK